MRRTSIEHGTWYYFTIDLNFEGHVAFTFDRYVKVNDRVAALVTFLERKYFATDKLLLLPSTRDAAYFRAGDDEILTVWTFDASSLLDATIVDLESEWPHNILDKAAITPSRRTAEKWTRGQP